ncbi:DUF945 family protein [Nitratifractor salsuginis]|uniref:DUF945 domain-containing protein n=1 Tax=Nitratifractor salsuginis (strain DSM 16511 / JCM 12458 / E9I37-1) TaxID=749222 RepID=E6X387_NITSE|nr:DUF945 family protein [Nitratifractor salsuginis]ADV47300.1 hypothetical protein Nitsa_2059 [Nitratifractor salsuginis DSM 16511]
MKKKLIAILIVLAAVFLGGRAWISSHGEQYLKEVLDAYNRGQRGEAVADLRHFENGFSSARAEINVSFPGAETEDFPLQNPLIIPARLRYGPVVEGLSPALMELEFDDTINRWLKPEVRKHFEEEVEGNVTLRYRGFLDWSKKMHEKITIGQILSKDPHSEGFLLIAPIRIRSDYDLRTLAGKATLLSEKIHASDPNQHSELNITRPELAMEVTEFPETGPIFGRLMIRAKEISLTRSDIRPPIEMRFSGSIGGALLHSAPQEAGVAFGTDLHTEDPATIHAWQGLRRVKTDLKVSGLGLKGLEELSALQQRQLKLQQELGRASGAGDDVAMQKAILALQSLNDDWIKIYNDLLIPGKTHLTLNETLVSKKTSTLKLDLTFTGQKLRGNAMSAMIALMAHLDRLVEGSFELTLEKELAHKLYPNAVFILDSMVSKNMATLKEGLYHLKGRIKEGKIIINGTKYAPQELIMMILM